jgi:DNA-binding transcriptional LysR family regulator
MRPHLTAMLDAADAARATAEAKTTRRSETLKIGLGPGIGAGAIAGVIREVTGALDVTIHLSESGPAALVEAMLSDMLDCALLPDHFDIPERLNRWKLYRDNAVAVLPPEHRLLARNAVTAADVADETILVGEFCGGFATRLAAETSYALRLQRCHGATTQMLELVAAGLGIALLSDRLRFASPLATRQFTEPDLSRGVLLAVVAGRPLNPAAASFVKLCRAQRFS